MTTPLTKFIPDEASMMHFGMQLAGAVMPGTVIFLNGQLGAGKTTLVRGFLRGFHYHDRVKSPTYTLVEAYELEKITIFHFDLYRVNYPQELEFIGIQEYFKSDTICLIEWPEKGASILPVSDLTCFIEMHNAGRDLKLIANTEHGQTILQRWRHD